MLNCISNIPHFNKVRRQVGNGRRVVEQILLGLVGFRQKGGEYQALLSIGSSRNEVKVIPVEYHSDGEFPSKHEPWNNCA